MQYHTFPKFCWSHLHPRNLLHQSIVENVSLRGHHEDPAIGRLVPKDGAYEASLQPEGFSAVWPFWIFQSRMQAPFLQLDWICEKNVLSPPNSRRARPEMLHLKWQTSPKKQ